MQRAQSPHQIHGVNPDHRPSRKSFRDSVEGDAVVRVIERWYKNDAIGDIEVRVTGGKPLAIHHDWPRERNRHNPERIFLCRQLETTHVVGRSGVVVVRRIAFIRQNNGVRRAEAGDVVDVAMGVVPDCALSQPYGIARTEVFVERLLVVAGLHSGVPHLDVSEEPLLRHHDLSAAIHFDAAPFEDQPLAVVGTPRYDPRQSGDALDLSADLGVVPVVGVLGPAVEPPVEELDLAISADHARRRRVPEPHPVVGYEMNGVTALIDSVRAEQRARVLGDSGIMTKNLHSLVGAECADDLRIDPWNRRKLSRPIGLVVWPREPGRFVSFPLRGHAPAERRLDSQSAASLWSGAFALTRWRAPFLHPI